MKKYNIVYFFWIENRQSGFGNQIIEENEDEDIFTEAELTIVRDYIIETNGFDGCVILNIIPLNG